MKKFIFFILSSLFFVLVFGEAYGQDENDGSQFMPDGMQSPTAASLGKFGDIPVNLYTGTPDISVPLHEASGVNLSLPIQLKYHASGVKVREIAGWVGLGWNLNAGGVITRTVRGLPDERTNGYLDTRDQLESLAEDQSHMIDVIKGVKNETIDPEPDMFFYNFAGYTGKFVLKDKGYASPQVYGEPVNDTQIKIEWKNPNSTDGTNKFVVTVEDGTRFTFAEREIVKESSDGSLSPRPSYPASWYLTKVESPQSQEAIELEYQIDTSFYMFTQDVSSRVREKMDCSQNTVILPNDHGLRYFYRHQIIRHPILEKIKTQKETVTFNSDFQRNDPGKVKLNTISIHRNGSFAKKFEFDYSYNNSGASEDSERRLLLDTVTEVGAEGDAKPPHQFLYDNTALPDRMSFGIDHWGYYNGKDSNNNTLIPEYKDLSGADREPSFPEVRAGSLTNIIYPTGGSTELVYEPHSYNWIGGVELSDEEFYKSLTASASAGGTHPVEVVYDDTTAFTVDYGHEVELIYNLSCPDPDRCGTSSTYVRLKDSSGNIIRFVDISGSETFYKEFLYLNPGKYTLEAHADEYTTQTGDSRNSSAGILVIYKTEDSVAVERNKPAGGLRIAKTLDNAGTGNQNVREFKYTMADDSLKSSGVLVSKPAYYYSGYVDLVTVADGRRAGNHCYVEFRSSKSNVPLGSTQGSHVSYQYVTTIFGDGGENGSKHSKFVTARSEPDGTIADRGNSKPGRRTSRDWKRGVPLEERIIKQNGDLLEKKSYKYDNIELTKEVKANSGIAPSYPALHFTQFTHPPLGLNVGKTYLYLISEIEIERGVKLKTSTTTRSYNVDQTDFAEQSQTFIYEDETWKLSVGQLQKKIETNFDGSQRITDYTYAHEVADDGTGVSYMPMRNRHMLIQPYSVEIRNGDGQVLQKQWTLWRYESSTDRWLRDSEWNWTGGNADGPVFNINNN